MPEPTPDDITQLLVEWRQGNQDAFNQLMPLVYSELHRIAEVAMARIPRNHPATLQPTVLIHEAYLRLVDQSRIEWQDRGHFFAVAAKIVRALLVDDYRRRAAQKRGANEVEQLPSDAPGVTSETDTVDILNLHLALEELETLDKRQAEIVELRFFGGLSHEEIGEVLGISRPTVDREWRMARAWLRATLNGW